MRPPFLHEFHYLRAFTIILIVAAHTLRLPSEYHSLYPDLKQVLDNLNETAFHASTLLLLFITGFLFAHLHDKHAGIAAYYRNRLLYVYLPYVLLSIAIVLEKSLPVGLDAASLAEFASSCAWHIVHGKADLQYWYLPFVLPIFLLSPALLTIPPRRFGMLVLAASLLPLLGTRAGTEITLGQYLYFLPAYLQGIYVARHYDSLRSTIEKHRGKLIATVIVTSLGILAMRTATHENTYMVAGINLCESLYYVQKTALCLLALSFLSSLKPGRTTWMLDRISVYSFAIYFLHLIVDRTLANHLFDFHPEHPLFAILVAGLRPAATILATLLFCVALKKLIGKHSRLLVGA